MPLEASVPWSCSQWWHHVESGLTPHCSCHICMQYEEEWSHSEMSSQIRWSQNPVLLVWHKTGQDFQGLILTFCFTGQQDQLYQQISGPQKISLTPNCWREICKGWAVHFDMKGHKLLFVRAFPITSHRCILSILSKLNEGNIFLVLWIFEAWRD